MMRGNGRPSRQRRTVLLACYDPHQWQEVKDFCARTGLYDGPLHRLSGVPGGGYVFTNRNPAVREFYTDALGLCVERHGVSRVIVVNHHSCGMYGNAHTPAQERDLHILDVKKACRYVHETFPALNVCGFVCPLAEPPHTFATELIYVCEYPPTNGERVL